MATELQKQIAQLKASQLNAEPVHKGRPSLFLTPQEAAAVDVEEVYEAGIGALRSLEGLDSRFSSFVDTLFHPSSVRLQRELKTSQDNKNLDQQIASLLSILSIFVVEKPAHLVMEYLIRRYRIHELNAEALLRSVISIHDSKIFARVVQLCSIQGTNWAFLHGVKTSGSPLPRNILCKNVASNAELFSIIRGTIMETIVSLSTTNSSDEAISGAERLITFFTTLVVNLFELKSISDSQLRVLLPYLLNGLKVPSNIGENRNIRLLDSWRKSCAIMLATIAKKSFLSEEFLKSLVASLSEGFSIACVDSDDNAGSNQLGVEIIYLIAILCQFQFERVSFNTSSLKNLFFDLLQQAATIDSLSSLENSLSFDSSISSKLIDAVVAVKDKFDVRNLIQCVLGSVFQVLTDSTSGSRQPPTSVEKELGVMIFELIFSKGLGDAALGPIAIVLVRHVVSHSEHGVGSEVYQKYIHRMLQLLYRRRPDILNKVVSGLQESFSDNAGLVRIMDSLSGHNLQCVVDNTNVSLLLSLNSPNANDNVKGIKQLLSEGCFEFGADDAERRDLVGLAEAFCNCLLSQNYTVASIAWSKEIIVSLSRSKLIAADIILEIYNAAFSQWCDVSMKSRTLCVQMLERLIGSVGDEDVQSYLCTNSSILLNSELELSGMEWNLLMLIQLLLGSNQDLLAKESSNSWYDLLGAWAISIASQGLSSFSEFASSIKTFAKTDDNKVVDNLADAFITVLESSEAEIIVQFLQQTTTFCSISPFESRTRTRFVVLMGQMMSRVCQSIRINPELRERLLQFTVTVIIKGFSVAEDTETRICVNSLSKLISTIAKAPNNNFEFAGKLDHHNICLLLCTKIPVTDVQFRCLNFILDSSLSTAAPASNLLGPCLSTGIGSSSDVARQGTHTVLPLLRFAFQGFEWGKSTNPDANMLHISTASLAGAIHGISAWLNSIAIGEQHGCLLSVIFCLMILACSHTDNSIRASGLALAKKYSKFIEEKSIITFDTEVVQISVFAHIAQQISNDAATIALDFSAARSIIIKLIFNKQSLAFRSAAWAILSMVSCISSTSEWTAASLLPFAEFAELDKSWKYISSAFETRSRVVRDSAVSHLFNKAIISRLSHMSTASTETQAEIVAWMIHLLASRPKKSSRVDESKDVTFQARGDVINLLLCTSSDWISQIKSKELQHAFISCLINEYIATGDSRIMRSTSFAKVDAKLLNELVNKIHSNFEAIHAIASKAYDVDSPESFATTGLSTAVQSLHYFLEIAKFCFIDRNLMASSKSQIAAVSTEEDRALVVVIVKLFDLLSMCCHPMMAIVMATEYCRTLLTDVITSLVSKFNSSAIVADVDSSESKPKKKGKQSSDATSVAELLTVNQLKAFVEVAVNSLNYSKRLQSLMSSLSMISLLCKLLPSGTERVINDLCVALSSHCKFTSASAEQYIHELMRTLVGLIAGLASDDASAMTRLQEVVIRSLFEGMGNLSHGQRSMLLEMAVKSFGSKSASACVLVLTNHILNGYSSNSTSNDQSVVESNKDTTYVVLSLAAQRKARRALKTSVSEEIYQSLIVFLNGLPIEDLLQNFVAIIKNSSVLLEKLFPSEDELAVVNGSDSSAKGLIAAQILLLLEVLFDIFGNRKFHINLAEFERKLAAESNCSLLQQYMLQISDELLQLYTNSNRHQLSAGLSTGDICDIQLVDGVVSVRTGVLCIQVGGRSLDILKSMQVVMDAPSFIAIFQELLNHQDTSVRQNAIQMLNNRLEDPVNGVGRLDGSEVELCDGAISCSTLKPLSLMLDLFVHLCSVVLNLKPSLEEDNGEEQASKKGNKKAKKAITSEIRTFREDTVHTYANLVGLAQSAVLCMDMLARGVKSVARKPAMMEAWQAVLKKSLGSVLAVSNLMISKSLEEVSEVPESIAARVVALRADELKFLGTLLLLCSSMSGALGAAALANFNVLLSSSLATIEGHVARVIDASVSLPSTIKKAKTLLLRSCVSAISTAVKGLPNFAHPYLSRILTTELSIYNFHGSSFHALFDDVDHSLTSILSTIPARLSIPCILSCTPLILGVSPRIAFKYAHLLRDFWNEIDRSTLVSHLNELFSVGVFCLDYRRVYGSGVADNDTHPDYAIVDAMSQLCMKLTESELRSHILKLLDWKNINAGGDVDEQEDVQGFEGKCRYSRGVSYYRFLLSLADKLKALVTPCMGLIWIDASEILKSFPAFITKSLKSKQVVSNGAKEQSGRKRLKGEKSTIDVSFESDVNKRKISVTDNICEDTGALNELKEQVIAIMKTIKVSCSNDNSGFVDQAHYEQMCPAVYSILPLKGAHADDETYIRFSCDIVIPCITALVIAVGKDVLWKPLNHFVLMTTRDKRKPVRMVALHAIRALFSEVGEEYLLLLPECLPFFAELLEDDDSEVTALTATVIREVEELSGENLDSYLQ